MLKSSLTVRPYAQGDNMDYDDEFSDEFSEVIGQFAATLEVVLQSYDYVVLVARKAVCLYYALRANGLCRSTGSQTRVISSRALEFGFIGQLGGKSVALVDDVVLTGGSMQGAVSGVRRLKGTPDIYIAALSADCSLTSLDGLYVKAARCVGPRVAYRLAREVVRYIQKAGITLNIDQPVFRIAFDGATALDPSKWLDVTTPAQRSVGLVSASMLLDANEMLGDLPGSDGAIVKARVQYNVSERKLSLIPFVLLTDVDREGALKLLSSSVDESLIEEMRAASGRGRKRFLRCAIRMVRYAMSRQLGKRILESMGWEDREYPDPESEEMLFGRRVSGEFLFESFPDLDPCNHVISCRDEDATCLGTAANAMHEALLRAESAKRHGRKPSGGSLADVSAVTLPELERSVRDRVGAERSVLLTSAALDLLIDGGVLVPCLRRSRVGKRFQRAYKGGEVFRLKEENYLFVCNVLRQYCKDIEGRENCSLDVDTANRLAILCLCWLDGRHGDIVSFDYPGVSDDQYDFDAEGMRAVSRSTQGTLIDSLVCMEEIAIESGEIRFTRSESGNLTDSRYIVAAFARLYASLLGIVCEHNKQDACSRFRDILDKLIITSSSSFRIRYLAPSLSKLKLSLLSAMRGQANSSVLAEHAQEVIRRCSLPHTSSQVGSELEIIGFSPGDVGLLMSFQQFEEDAVDVEYAKLAESHLEDLAKRVDCLVGNPQEGDEGWRSRLRGCCWTACSLQHAFERFFEPRRRFDWGYLRVCRYHDNKLYVPDKSYSWEPDSQDFSHHHLIEAFEKTCQGDLVIFMMDELSGSLYMPPVDRAMYDDAINYIYPKAIRNTIRDVLKQYKPDRSNIILWFCSSNQSAVTSDAVSSILDEMGIGKTRLRACRGAQSLFDLQKRNGLFIARCAIAPIEKGAK